MAREESQREEGRIKAHMKGLISLVMEAAREWLADRAAIYAAALSYHMLLALAPLVVIAVGIIGLFFGDQFVGEITREAGNHFGDATQDEIQQVLDNMKHGAAAGTIAVASGGVVLLFTATGAFRSLRKALNAVLNVEPAPTGRDARKIGWRILLQLMLTLMVLGLGLIIGIFVALSSLWGSFWQSIVGSASAPEWLARSVDFFVTLGLTTVAFAALLVIVPLARIDRRDLWLGAALTALLFDVGKLGFSVYMSHSSLASAYGAAGSLVVFLIWVYYSAMIIFFGAEFAQAYGRRHGREVRPRKGARPATHRPAEL